MSQPDLSNRIPTAWLVMATPVSRHRQRQRFHHDEALSVFVTAMGRWLDLAFTHYLDELKAARELALVPLCRSLFNRRELRLVQNAFNQRWTVKLYSPEAIEALWRSI